MTDPTDDPDQPAERQLPAPKTWKTGVVRPGPADMQWPATPEDEVPEDRR